MSTEADETDEARDYATGLVTQRRFVHGEPDRAALGLDGIDPAEQYHEASKIHRDFPAQMWGPGGFFFYTADRAAFRLGRKSLAHTGPGLTLPPPLPLPIELGDVIQRRRSSLPPDAGPLTTAELATLLALTAGPSTARPGLRVTPSAGALYPIDLLVMVGAVEGIEPGGYAYDSTGQRLVRRLELDVERFHARAAVGEAMPTSSITIALVATFARTRVKYGLRGYRFALLEAGHLAQGLVTVATALGLSSLPWGGFADDDVDRVLELDGVERSCVYLVSVSRER